MEKFICESYLRFVRMHPCAVCRKEKNVEADHLSARGWGSAKRNDLVTLALCHKHHMERGQIGNSKFETRYQVNLWQEVSRLHIELLMNMREMREVILQGLNK